MNLSNQAGFTLIELIMVIVMLGVLAVFAAPRMFNTGDFTARGFHDETLSLLRYAQKTAIAQRRTVCVAFTSNRVSLSMASAAAATNCATSTSTAMTGPNGEATVTGRSGVRFDSSSPSNWDFNFNGLGQPIDTSGVPVTKRTIEIVDAGKIYVEAETGYVHD